MIFYTVYKTINLLNQKFYIGVHKTSNPNDNYLGSGIYLKEAIKKYGKENFKKEILNIFSSKEEAYQLEKIIVNEKFISNDDTYNIALGGVPSMDWNELQIQKMKSLCGENHFMYGRKLPIEWRQHISLGGIGRINSEETRKKISKSNKGRVSYWKGKTQTEESNRKRSESHKNLIKLECPYCGKLSEPGNAKRWHFENCHHNSNNIPPVNISITCPHCGKIGNNTAAMSRWHFNNCTVFKKL